MASPLTPAEAAQLAQTIEMFEAIVQTQPLDYQSLEILKEAYVKLGRDKDVIHASKRIASAYRQMGQISSAILEYEGILQRYPGDDDALAALTELSDTAAGLGGEEIIEVEDASGQTQFIRRKTGGARPAPAVCDDGRKLMEKIFVESKAVAPGDFALCWPEPDPFSTPDKVTDPFIQTLADKSILPLERSLKLLADKSRLGYLPFDRYDLDLDLARKFPAATCQRWCVLPFDRMSKSILVATANPFNRQAASELEQGGKHRLVWYLAAPPDLIKAIRKATRLNT